MLCRQFAEACGQALEVNERLIKEDQLEYQEEMKSHYKDMLSELSEVMNEQVSLSVVIFRSLELLNSIAKTLVISREFI